MKRRVMRREGVCCLLACLAAAGAAAQSNLTVYHDSVAAGWDDWSWSCVRDFNNSSPKYSGSKSVSLTYSAWGALALHHADLAVTNYDYLQFYVHGGTNAGLDADIYLTYSNADFAAVRLTNYLAGGTIGASWKQARIPMAHFNCTSQRFTKINWKECFGSSWGACYLDEIVLVNTNAPVGDTNVVNLFSITSRLDSATGDLLVDFSGQTCAYYQVWTATSLIDAAWSEAAMALGTELAQSWTHGAAGDVAFVRLSGLLHTESGDADGDGLLDVYELQHVPLDPLSEFSDADSLPDGWEVAYDLSPTNTAGDDGDEGDPDADGRDNAAEYDSGTNPQWIERNEAPLYLDYPAGPWYHDGNLGGWIDPSSASYVLSNSYALRAGLPSNNSLAILRVVGSNYVSTVGFTNLEFWVNGGTTSRQSFYVGVRLEENTWPGGADITNYATLQTNQWSHVRIPLAHLSAHDVTNLAWVFFKNTGTNPVPAFWVDNMSLVSLWPTSRAAIAVDASAPVSPPLTRRLFGINVAAWDALLTSEDTAARLREGGFTMLRYPGGSLADYYDWQNNRNKTNAAEVYSVNTSNFLALADSVGAEKNITVNYGRGTPAEASNWVRHVFGTLNRTVEWWCVGNEVFASWEHDTNVPPHDAVKFASLWRQYRTAMTNARPGIQLGVPFTYSPDDFTNAHPAVTNPVDGTVHRGWSAVLLHELSNSPPDFVELHYYGYAEGTSMLLPPDRASDFHLLRSPPYERRAVEECRTMLCDYLGPVAGSNVAIHVTENNCTSYDPGKQSLSLINALFVPGMFGQAALAGADAFLWWDLHNNPATGGNNSSTLHGWRNYGDFGLLAVGGAVPLGDTVNEPYPPFYGFKLLTNFARPGDRLVAASNTWPSVLQVYASLSADSNRLSLLAVNASPDSSLKPAISLSGFTAGSNVVVHRYGMAEDSNRWDITSAAAVVDPTNITCTFPPYSMTVICF